MAQMVKNTPAMQKACVRSLGWEDPLEGDMATHYSILAWTVPMDRGAWWVTVHGVAELDTTEQLSRHSTSSSPFRLASGHAAPEPKANFSVFPKQ